MSTLNSSDVIVFPATQRSPDYAQTSRYLNELNITNIIKSITNKDSYIIYYDPQSAGLKPNLVFVLFGYYFQVKYTLPSSDNSDNLTDIYAQIKIDNDELEGGDSDNKYIGLDIGEKNTSDYTHHLLLFKYVDDNFILAEENKARFDDSAVEGLHVIDCGIL